MLCQNSRNWEGLKETHKQALPGDRENQCKIKEQDYPATGLTQMPEFRLPR